MAEQTPQGVDPNLLLLMHEMLQDRQQREAQIEEVRREREEERQQREEEARLQREEERHEREEERHQREEETYQQLVVLQTLVKGIQMQGEVAAKKDKDVKLTKLAVEGLTSQHLNVSWHHMKSQRRDGHTNCLHSWWERPSRRTLQ